MPDLRHPPRARQPEPGPGRRGRAAGRTLLTALGTAAVVTATVLTTTVTGSGAAVAVPVPATPTGLPAAIEALQPYVGQKVCEPVAKPGVRAFSTLILNTYRDTSSLGIVRDCGIGGQSEHKEGRAFDWGVRVDNAKHVSEANAVLTWLLATDANGERAARARRLGIMYMIFNKRIWKAYQVDKGWQPYSGVSPHTDHVHFSFGWNGARQTTSWWDRTVAPVDYGPGGAPLALAGSATQFVPYGSNVLVAGKAAPRAKVEIWFKRRSIPGYVKRRDLVAGADGRFSTTYLGLDDYRIYAVTGGRPSAEVLYQAAPTIDGPSQVVAPYGSTVEMTGTGLPGTTVYLAFRRATDAQGTYPTRRATAVAPDGTWVRPFLASEEYTLYASRTPDAAPARLLQVPTSPAIDSPESGVVLRGSTITLTGVTRPDALLWLHFRKATDAPGTYPTLRAVRASADGSWVRPFLADQDYRVYATHGESGPVANGMLYQVVG